MVSERAIIRRIVSELGEVYSPGSRLSREDDAGEALEGVLLNIDGYSEKGSRYPWESLEDWGWKAVVASITDLLAKGARPLAIAVSLGVPPSASPDDVAMVARGIREACVTYGLKVVKGDVNRSEEGAWIDVAALGVLVGPRPVPRQGAEEGDFVYTTLVNGYGKPYGVYRLLLRGAVGLEEAKRICARPKAPVGFLEVLKEARVKAATDVSDGLAFSLYSLAVEGGVTIELKTLPEVAGEVLRLYESREELELYVLYGGEEYEIVFVSDELPGKVTEVCERAGTRCVWIGSVKKGEGRVTLKGLPLRLLGWDHFAE